MILTRRTALAGGLALTAIPGLAFARAAGERRFIFLMLRGGWDGLAVVSPVGDPAYAAARGRLAELPEAAGAAVRLDADFALHPALATGAALYRAGELGFVHAVASPYRDRSHFDGQKVVESGGTSPLALETGWLNRLLPLVGGPPALAVAPSVPLALRGPAPATSHAPSRLPDASDDLMRRVGDLYAADPLLDPLWEKVLAARMLAGDSAGRATPEKLAEIAARFLADPAGPRIAMIEQDGWDTHAQQPQRLTNQLRQLDRMLATLKSGLGPSWATTLVIGVSEFGRTVAANGTGGTDHGTAGLALVAGGASRGGRVLADWPGLAPGARLDGRDLKPTTDLRALLLGAVAGHFGLDPAPAARAMFPGASLRPLGGLIRT